MRIFTVFALASTLPLALGCSDSLDVNSNPDDVGAKTLTQLIQTKVDQMAVTGATLTLNGTLIADLTKGTAITTIYGTVTRGQTLNVLTDGDMQFLVYGEDGVFAAECEPNPLDATFGPTHPLCQTVHAESADTIIVCFANTETTDIMVAQNWVGFPQALEEGHGLICYHDGVKMLSSRVFTY